MADDSAYVNSVTSDIRRSIINNKANACPMAVRLAWHASVPHSRSHRDPTNTRYVNAGLLDV